MAPKLTPREGELTRMVACLALTLLVVLLLYVWYSNLKQDSADLVVPDPVEGSRSKGIGLLISLGRDT